MGKLVREKVLCHANRPSNPFDEGKLLTLSPNDLAKKYCVDDLPGAVIPGSQLRPILDNVERGRPIGVIAEAFLGKKGLSALQALAAGTLTFEAFRSRALVEQQARLAAEMQRTENEEAERQRRKAESKARIDAFFVEQQNDPVRRRSQENKRLKARYELGFVAPEVYARVMQLVRKIDARQRLLPDDVTWLSTKPEVWTPELFKAHHRLEAEEFTKEWKKTRNPWAAITASGHWRKAEQPKKALEVTESAETAIPALGKQRSALCTTRGGAMRDLGRLPEALELGHEAHRLAPEDFRPCTLLGAVYIGLGDHQNGAEWFEEAERLGAQRDDVDQELRAILARSTREERGRLRSFLLSRDEHRFAWVSELAEGGKI